MAHHLHCPGYGSFHSVLRDFRFWQFRFTARLNELHSGNCARILVVSNAYGALPLRILRCVYASAPPIISIYVSFPTGSSFRFLSAGDLLILEKQLAEASLALIYDGVIAREVIRTGCVWCDLSLVAD